MNLHETELSSQPVPRGANMKFTYANGDQPLAGFTIKRGIGQGGFGEVYYALSEAGKEVALKRILRSLEVELRGVGHCLNLKHPNLIALYDIRHDEHDDHWVVMEYVTGRSLEEAIAGHPDGMSVPETLAWIHGIGAGVAYLHDKGVVHRDLKPANIFSDEGLVKIGDYGLAKFISTSRRSGQTESVGTVHYMAPEISHGKYGKEIDIYALGVMLYEMLTGTVPFEGESVGEVLMKHMTAQPDVSVLSSPFREVVARALAKDPAERFSSVAAFLAGLPGPAVQPHLLPANGRQPADPSPVGPATVPAAAAVLPVRPVSLVQEEPLWQATREAGRQIGDAWTRANFSLPIKVVILLAGAFAVVKGWMLIVPAVLCGLGLYGAYRVVRALLLTRAGGPVMAAAAASPFAAPPPVAAPPPRAGPPPPPPPLPIVEAAPGRRTWRLSRCRQEQSMPAMIVKPVRQQVTELLGSLLLSTLVVVSMSVVMALFMQQPSRPEEFAWLALVGTAAAWGVLIPSKFWEGAQGEQLPRRFLMLLVGLGLGALAFFAANALLVDLRWVTPPGLPPIDGYPWGLTGATGQPLLKGFLVHFGLLFPVLRWWRLADPLRATRLSIWSVVVCSFWAWMLGAVWPFPQLSGVMLAATVAIAVQLASPWVDARRTA